MRGHVRVVFVQIGIIQVTLDDPLPQTIGHRDVGHAVVISKHASMAGDPVATLHVLRRPGKQQLAEAQAGHEHVSFVDLAGLDVVPLDRIAGVVDLDALAGLERPRGDAGFTALRELAIELFLLYISREETLSTGRLYSQVVTETRKNVAFNQPSNKR